MVDAATDRVQEFTPDGDFVRGWGSTGTFNGQFIVPSRDSHRLCGRCLCRRRHQRPGREVHLHVAPTCPSGERSAPPTGISTPQTGSRSAPTTPSTSPTAGNNRVEKFSSSGTYLGKWGSHGTANGKFDTPLGIDVGPTGNVFVVDSGNNRVEKFSPSGSVFLGAWGSTGTGNGKFNGAEGLAVSPGGSVYVTDVGNDRVEKFSPGGAFRGQFGSSGTGNGKFDAPIAVTTDCRGSVYVADYSNQRIQKFGQTGVLDPPCTTTPPPPPSNKFTFGALTRHTNRGTATIEVKLPGAGHVVLYGGGLKKQAKDLTAARTANMSLEPKHNLAHTLKTHGSVSVSFEVKFTPTGGSANTKPRTATLIQHTHHHRHHRR